MKRRIIVLPGYVVAADGDRHFITSAQLLDLHNIPTPWFGQSHIKIIQPNFRYAHVWREGDIELKPRPNGQYPNYGDLT